MNIDYSVIPALLAAARRERARAVHRLLVAPLVNFVRESLHAARAHRAVEG